LVRHGQAAFGQDDYDVLSELGRRQAAELGGHWARHRVKLDALYVGPRRRHQQTAEAMLAGARAAGGELPEGLPVAGFDEFPFQDIIKAAEPLIAKEAAELRAQLGGAEPLRERRSFDRLFTLAMTHWISGELDGKAPETFAHFVSRVRAGLQSVMAAHGRGCTVAVVTSAGPMAAALQLGLAVDDQMVLKLCAVMANTALAELRYRAGAELTVVSFNSTPHLLPELVTYR
jgi:broad specificity phosphatase PhoE